MALPRGVANLQAQTAQRAAEMQAAMEQRNAGMDAATQTTEEMNPWFLQGGEALLRYAGMVRDPVTGQITFDPSKTGDDPYTAALRAQAMGGQRQQLALRGVGGSAALNAQAQLGGQYDLQAIERKQQLLEGGYGLISTGLGNAWARPTAETARIAAENAGQGGGGDSGGSRGPFGK